MTTPSQLSDLPIEIIEMILCQLEDQDIYNLRLVSRTIDAASTQIRYNSFFISKTIQLESTAVSKFSAIVQRNCFAGLLHNRFAGRLQNLKLTGTERSQGIDFFRSGDADVLSTALRSLCSFHKQSQKYFLKRLTAGVTEEATPSSGAISRSTAASNLAVKTTLCVANDSEIPIEEIDLLYHSLACSVPCCMFKSPFGSVQPSYNWSALRRLSLSLTHHARYGAAVGLDDTDSIAVDNPPRESAEAGMLRVEALVDFFSLIPNIEELNLHWYGRGSLDLRDSDADAVEQNWFDQVSLAVSFHKLKHLVLHGLYLTQRTLQKVLTTPSLQQVHLENIHLTGSLRPILDVLISPNTAITQFYLDDIDGDWSILQSKATLSFLTWEVGQALVLC
ncbi:hypothetical protein E4T50_10054 [Aureobasidium sp. EXF-12298]|nr:hypothetical protein E4T50_10054 [Aureobasidium sp. EXF-12298]